MSDQPVQWKKQDGISVITMNWPANKNAFDLNQARYLVEALEDCYDPEVRAVILTASGTTFCPGGNLEEAREYHPEDHSIFFRELSKPLAMIINLIRRLPKPVIASVNGVAAGAGMSFALACDLRIASEKARFKQAYTSIGQNPDGAWTLLTPLLIGLAKASEMILLDELMDAQEALRLGLVNQVVTAEELETATMELARRLAKGPTCAYASSKELLNRAMLPMIETQMELERQGLMKCAHTEDYHESLVAFKEKRKPVFKGR
ncbi:MAG: enoyl-CoA hydratase/isomerase family protein [Methylocystaceae bacterium]